MAAPRTAAVLVIFTVDQGDLRVLLIHRSGEPFLGWWALPGGLLRPGETLAQAAARKLVDETGVADVYLEQLYTFDDLEAPGEAVAVAYFALVDAARVRLRAETSWEPAWHSIGRLPELAFANRRVIDYALTRLRNKLEYTNVAYSLLPPAFTLSDLQAVYESIFGRRFDKRNFRRRMLSRGIIRPTGRSETRGAHRPAELFEFGSRQPMVL
jgi:8-oxo-dGTP diphosphatase